MVDESAGMVILIDSAFRAVDDAWSIASAMAPFDGNGSVVRAVTGVHATGREGPLATKAETLPLHERRHTANAALEIPAINFIFLQCVATGYVCKD